MSENGRRRRRTATEKLRIVLAGMEPGVEISDLCRREGIGPAQYYGWKKKVLKSAERIFGEAGPQQSVKEERLTTELARMKGVVAEITAENLELKKGLSV